MHFKLNTLNMLNVYVISSTLSLGNQKIMAILDINVQLEDSASNSDEPCFDIRFYSSTL